MDRIWQASFVGGLKTQRQRLTQAGETGKQPEVGSSSRDLAEVEVRVINSFKICTCLLAMYIYIYVYKTQKRGRIEFRLGGGFARHQLPQLLVWLMSESAIAATVCHNPPRYREYLKRTRSIAI